MIFFDRKERKKRKKTPTDHFVGINKMIDGAKDHFVGFNKMVARSKQTIFPTPGKWSDIAAAKIEDDSGLWYRYCGVPVWRIGREEYEQGI